MNEKSLLSRINSKYVLQIILSYIDYGNKNFSLKLFKYSKKFREKLDITLFDYQEKIINDNCISLHKYLYSKSKFNNFGFHNSKNNDILKRNLKIDLFNLKLSENEMIQYLIHYYDKCFNKNEENFIDIYSPFFFFFSKEKKFNELFTIPISIKEIRNDKLLEAYILAFDMLNKLKFPYPKLKINFSNTNDINFLKDLKINFSLIQKIQLEPEKEIKEYNTNSLITSLSSLPNIKDNLICLDIKGTIKEEIKNDFFGNNNNVNQDAQDILNEFKSLRVLKLTDFEFENIFSLKITNLIELYLNHCKNITFKSEEDICLNLKKINFLFNGIIEPKNKIKAPELEEISFEGEFCHIFDYKSLEKLKYIMSEYCIIQYFINSPLQYVSFERSNLNNEKENLKKLISIQTLKKLQLKLSVINDKDIDGIEGVNNSLEELHLIWNNQGTECQIYNLQNKFPNVSKLIINAKNFYENNNVPKLEIEENHNLKIKKFEVIAQNKMIKFCVQSFEQLQYISLNIVNEIKNLKDLLPFFNDNCKKIFNYLTHFEFHYNVTSLDAKNKISEILNNLYNNIDKISNVRNFILSCSSKDIQETFYMKLIKKILSLRLNNCEIDVQKIENNYSGNYYSRKELKQICPNIYFGVEKILIFKFNKNK